MHANANQCMLSDDLPKLVRGDSARVVQIFANLISNSIKFTTCKHAVVVFFAFCGSLVLPLRRVNKQEFHHKVNNKEYKINTSSSCLHNMVLLVANVSQRVILY